MTADDNDHDHTREAPAMSEDTELTCDWCVLYSIAQPRTVSYGITVRDCCAGTTIDYLLCDQHWAILRDQRFPAECPRCGDLAATLDDIVTTGSTIEATALALTARGGTVVGALTLAAA